MAARLAFVGVLWPNSGASGDEVRAMLRTLLAKRFGLAVRSEMREMPLYALRLARTDGSLGPNLRRSPTECAGQRSSAVAGRVQCGILVSQSPTSASLRGGGATLTEFVRLFGDFLERPLIDETGLSGVFDFELQFAAARSSLPGSPVPGGLPASANVDDPPSVVTAVQEQLGLRLEARRGPTEVLVVEDVSQPSED